MVINYIKITAIMLSDIPKIKLNKDGIFNNTDRIVNIRTFFIVRNGGRNNNENIFIEIKIIFHDNKYDSYRQSRD